MSFAGHTMIAIPGGSNQIENLREGDAVLVAGVDLQWQAHTLHSILGTGPVDVSMVFLKFGATVR
ncbi:MAG: hypothetical protein AABO58_23765 [Acidobacteriota bacterium]